MQLVQLATNTSTGVSLVAAQSVLNATNSTGAVQSVIVTIRVANRGADSIVNLTYNVTCGGFMLGSQTLSYTSATSSIEIQSRELRWGAGEALAITLQSSSVLDNNVNVTVFVEGFEDTASMVRKIPRCLTDLADGEAVRFNDALNSNYTDINFINPP